MSATGVRRAMLAGTAAFASFVSTGAAQAQTGSGTTAGTEIKNTASATYTVSGVNQSKTSNEAKFVVDRKVNLTLTPDPANTQVSVGQTGAVLRFKLTNSTNGTQDFILSMVQAISLLGDNFDATNVKIYADARGGGSAGTGIGDGVYDSATDKLEFVNELGADESVMIYIVADIPADQAAALANITLTAQVAAGGDPSTAAAGPALTASLTNDDAVVDVVFADSDGIRDGRTSATLGYAIANRDVALTVAKSSLVMSDPVNGAVLPRALPGAVVRYCMIVSNATALVAANAINVTDTIPDNTTYVPGSITVGAIPLLGACILGTPMNDSGAAVALSPFTGSYTEATKVVKATIPTLVGPGAVAVTFQVKIN